MTPPVLLAVAKSRAAWQCVNGSMARVDELARGDRLQAAEQRVGDGIRAGQCDAEPAEQRREERIEPAGARERQAQRGVHAAVARGEGDGQHARDREQRPAHLPARSREDRAETPEADAQPDRRAHRGQEDARAGRGERVEVVDRRLDLPGRHHRRLTCDAVVQGGIFRRRPAGLSRSLKSRRPHRKTNTVSSTHGTHAEITAPRRYTTASCLTGGSPGKRHTSRGCQTRRKRLRPISDASPPATSTRNGP